MSDINDHNILNTMRQRKKERQIQEKKTQHNKHIKGKVREMHKILQSHTVTGEINR